VREVSEGVKRWSEPVPEPPQRVAGPAQFSFDLNGVEALCRVPLAGGPPLYELCFGNREGDSYVDITLAGIAYLIFKSEVYVFIG